MKVLKILAIAVICASFTTRLQAKALDEKYPSLYDAELEKKLKLTPQQVEIMKIIHKENQKKMNIFLMQIDTIHHEMAALVEENDEQIRDILSEKQKVKFDMYKYQQKKRKNEHQNEEKPSRKKMRAY